MAIKKLTDDICMVPGLVNVYLLDTDGGLVLLDTGFPGTAPKILAGIKQLGQAPADVRHIVLTHCHPDHIGSAAVLKRETGATVWAHPADAPLIESGTAGRRPMYPTPGLSNYILFKLLGGKIKQVEPVKG